MKQLDVLFEDNHLIAINKQGGDLVQGDKTGDASLSDRIKNYLKEKYNKPGNVYLGVVHRLDRPTTGVVLFARTSKAANRLSKQFREKQVHKTYWAIVERVPEEPEGTLEHWLKKNAAKNKSFALDSHKEGFKQAILHYRLLARGDRYGLLEVTIETGRHHQIRAQLATVGSIIKGDLKYGAKRSNPDQSISLHARSITVKHPVKKEPLTIEAPPPLDNLWNALTARIQ